MGIAMSQSSQGAVDVQFDASVLSDETDNSESGYSEKTTITTLPTTVYCEEGDHVIITLYGADGMLRPTVTGVSGGGDRMMEAISGGGSPYFGHDNAAYDPNYPQTTTPRTYVRNDAESTDENTFEVWDGAFRFKDRQGDVMLNLTRDYNLHRPISPSGRGWFPQWEDLLWCVKPGIPNPVVPPFSSGTIQLYASATNYEYLEIHFYSDAAWQWEGSSTSEVYNGASNLTVGCARVTIDCFPYSVMSGEVNTTLTLVVPDSATQGDTTTQTLNAFIHIDGDEISYYANPGNLKIWAVFGIKGYPIAGTTGPF
jgi:hypothetical protein